MAVEKGIITRLYLLAYANSKNLGKETDLAQFIVNRGTKAANEALRERKGLKESADKMEHSGLLRALITNDSKCFARALNSSNL